MQNLAGSPARLNTRARWHVTSHLHNHQQLPNSFVCLFSLTMFQAIRDIVFIPGRYYHGVTSSKNRPYEPASVSRNVHIKATDISTLYFWAKWPNGFASPFEVFVYTFSNIKTSSSTSSSSPGRISVGKFRGKNSQPCKLNPAVSKTYNPWRLFVVQREEVIAI